ncbi:15 kDa protein B-like [Rhynchocyon petersi]
MAGVWRVLLLVAGLTVVACVAHRHQRSKSYEEIVRQAVQFFNQGRRGAPLFRLLEVIQPPRLNSTSSIPLNFRIKETVCLSSTQRRLQDCAFREGGEERNCTGSYLRVRGLRILMLDCSRDSRDSESQQEASRKRRSLEEAGQKPAEVDTSKLPPQVREMYEKAKFDIIFNILKNF